MQGLCEDDSFVVWRRVFGLEWWANSQLVEGWNGGRFSMALLGWNGRRFAVPLVGWNGVREA